MKKRLHKKKILEVLFICVSLFTFCFSLINLTKSKNAEAFGGIYNGQAVEDSLGSAYPGVFLVQMVDEKSKPSQDPLNADEKPNQRQSNTDSEGRFGFRNVANLGNAADDFVIRKTLQNQNVIMFKDLERNLDGTLALDASGLPIIKPLTELTESIRISLGEYNLAQNEGDFGKKMGIATNVRMDSSNEDTNNLGSGMGGHYVFDAGHGLHTYGDDSYRYIAQSFAYGEILSGTYTITIPAHTLYTAPVISDDTNTAHTFTFVVVYESELFGSDFRPTLHNVSGHKMTGINNQTTLQTVYTANYQTLDPTYETPYPTLTFNSKNFWVSYTHSLYGRTYEYKIRRLDNANTVRITKTALNGQGNPISNDPENASATVSLAQTNLRLDLPTLGTYVIRYEPIQQFFVSAGIYRYDAVKIANYDLSPLNLLNYGYTAEYAQNNTGSDRFYRTKGEISINDFLRANGLNAVTTNHAANSVNADITTLLMDQTNENVRNITAYLNGLPAMTDLKGAYGNLKSQYIYPTSTTHDILTKDDPGYPGDIPPNPEYDSVHYYSQIDLLSKFTEYFENSFAISSNQAQIAANENRVAVLQSQIDAMYTIMNSRSHVMGGNYKAKGIDGNYTSNDHTVNANSESILGLILAQATAIRTNDGWIPSVRQTEAIKLENMLKAWRDNGFFKKFPEGNLKPDWDTMNKSNLNYGYGLEFDNYQILTATQRKNNANGNLAISNYCDGVIERRTFVKNKREELIQLANEIVGERGEKTTPSDTKADQIIEAINGIGGIKEQENKEVAAALGWVDIYMGTPVAGFDTKLSLLKQNENLETDNSSFEAKIGTLRTDINTIITTMNSNYNAVVTQINLLKSNIEANYTDNDKNLAYLILNKLIASEENTFRETEMALFQNELAFWSGRIQVQRAQVQSMPYGTPNYLRENEILRRYQAIYEGFQIIIYAPPVGGDHLLRVSPSTPEAVLRFVNELSPPDSSANTPAQGRSVADNLDKAQNAGMVASETLNFTTGRQIFNQIGHAALTNPSSPYYLGSDYVHASTNQPPVWLNYIGEFYNDNRGEQGDGQSMIYFKAYGQNEWVNYIYQKNSRFYQAGTYFVKIAYKQEYTFLMEYYENGEYRTQLRTITLNSNYQYFYFEITNTEPDSSLYFLDNPADDVENPVSDKILLQNYDYTNRIVYLDIFKGSHFDKMFNVQFGYSTLGSRFPTPNQTAALNDTNQITDSQGRIGYRVEFVNSGHHSLLIRYGASNAQYEVRFTIDKNPIILTPYEIKMSTNGNGEIIEQDPTRITKDSTESTGGDFILGWKPKLGGANVTATYSFVSINELTGASADALDNIANAGISGNEWILAKYKGSENLITDIEYKGTLQNGELLGPRRTENGIYLFFLTDDAGNSKVYYFVIDKTTPNFVLQEVPGPNGLQEYIGYHGNYKAVELQDADDPDDATRIFDSIPVKHTLNGLGYINSAYANNETGTLYQEQSRIFDEYNTNLYIKTEILTKDLSFKGANAMSEVYVTENADKSKGNQLWAIAHAPQILVNGNMQDSINYYPFQDADDLNYFNTTSGITVNDYILPRRIKTQTGFEVYNVKANEGLYFYKVTDANSNRSLEQTININFDLSRTTMTAKNNNENVNSFMNKAYPTLSNFAGTKRDEVIVTANTDNTEAGIAHTFEVEYIKAYYFSLVYDKAAVYSLNAKKVLYPQKDGEDPADWEQRLIDMGDVSCFPYASTYEEITLYQTGGGSGYLGDIMNKLGTQTRAGKYMIERKYTDAFIGNEPLDFDGKASDTLKRTWTIYADRNNIIQSTNTSGEDNLQTIGEEIKLILQNLTGFNLLDVAVGSDGTIHVSLDTNKLPVFINALQNKYGHSHEGDKIGKPTEFTPLSDPNDPTSEVLNNPVFDLLAEITARPRGSTTAFAYANHAEMQNRSFGLDIEDFGDGYKHKFDDPDEFSLIDVANMFVAANHISSSNNGDRSIGFTNYDTTIYRPTQGYELGGFYIPGTYTLTLEDQMDREVLLANGRRDRGNQTSFVFSINNNTPDGSYYSNTDGQTEGNVELVHTEEDANGYPINTKDVVSVQPGDSTTFKFYDPEYRHPVTGEYFEAEINKDATKMRWVPKNTTLIRGEIESFAAGNVLTLAEDHSISLITVNSDFVDIYNRFGKYVTTAKVTAKGANTLTLDEFATVIPSFTTSDAQSLVGGVVRASSGWATPAITTKAIGGGRNEYSITLNTAIAHGEGYYEIMLEFTGIKDNYGFDGHSFFRETYVLAVDGTRPQTNIDELIATDKDDFLVTYTPSLNGSPSVTDLKERGDLRSYAFVIDEEFAFQKATNNNYGLQDVFSSRLDTYAIYYREIPTSTVIGSINYKLSSRLPDDADYNSNTSNKPMFSETDTGNYHKFNYGVKFATLSGIDNINGGFYEIIERDQAGNYQGYFVLLNTAKSANAAKLNVNYQNFIKTNGTSNYKTGNQSELVAHNNISLDVFGNTSSGIRQPHKVSAVLSPNGSTGNNETSNYAGLEFINLDTIDTWFRITILDNVKKQGETDGQYNARKLFSTFITNSEEKTEFFANLKTRMPWNPVTGNHYTLTIQNRLSELDIVIDFHFAPNARLQPNHIDEAGINVFTVPDYNSSIYLLDSSKYLETGRAMVEQSKITLGNLIFEPQSHDRDGKPLIKDLNQTYRFNKGVYRYTFLDNYGRITTGLFSNVENAANDFINYNHRIEEVPQSGGGSKRYSGPNLRFEYQSLLYSDLKVSTRNALGVYTQTTTGYTININQSTLVTTLYFTNANNREIDYRVELMDITGKSYLKDCTYFTILSPITIKDINGVSQNTPATLANASIHFELREQPFHESVTVRWTYTDINGLPVSALYTNIQSGYQLTEANKGLYEITISNALGLSQVYRVTIDSRPMLPYHVMDSRGTMLNPSHKPFAYKKSQTDPTLVNVWTQYVTIDPNYEIITNDLFGILATLEETGDNYKIYRIHTDEVAYYHNEYIKITVVPATDSIANLRPTLAGAGTLIVYNEIIRTSTVLIRYNSYPGDPTYDTPNYTYAIVTYNNAIGKEKYDYTGTINLQDAGNYTITFCDLAGNVHKFQSATGGVFSSLNVYVVTKVLATVQGHGTLFDRMVFNETAFVQVLNSDKFTNIGLTARLNGIPTEVEMLSNNYVLDKSGVYSLTFTVRINSETKTTTYNVFMIKPDESRLGLEYRLPNNYNITHIYKRHVAQKDPSPDDQDIVEYVRNDMIQSGFMQPGDNLTKLTISMFANGDARYYVCVDIKNQGFVADDTFAFDVLISNSVPVLRSNVAFGTKTTKRIEVTYKPSEIFIANGSVVLEVRNRKGNLIIQDIINHENWNDDTDKVIKLSAAGKYSFMIKTEANTAEFKDGTIIYWTSITKQDPLNAGAIILIVIGSIGVIGAIVLFLKLRTRMKVR